MTQDRIIELAREAGFEQNSLGMTYTSGSLSALLERFAALVRTQALEEVEQKVPCGKHTDKWGSCRIADYNRGWNDYRKQCAAAIQALKGQA